MHWVCSALKSFPVMWVMGYNNSYMDGSVVSMTWAHSHHLQGTSHPQTRAAPKEATQDGVAGGSRRGHKGTSNPLSHPASSSLCWAEGPVTPFHSLAWAGPWAGGHWQHQHLLPHEEAQAMGGLNSSSVNREHESQTFKPSFWMSIWLISP